MRTLVIDDNLEYAQMLQMALAEYGKVDVAENGTEGFKAFCNALKNDTGYHLICLDVNMPMRDGFETVQYIRMMEQKLFLDEDQLVKIVLVSGFADHANARRALQAGAEALMSKTDGINKLLARLQEMGVLP